MYEQGNALGAACLTRGRPLGCWLRWLGSLCVCVRERGLG